MKQFFSRVVMVMALLLFGVSTANASDWTGLYVGLALSSETMEVDWQSTQHYDPGGSPIAFSSDPSETVQSQSPRGSVYLGYNLQLGTKWVIGVEGDVGTTSGDEYIRDRIPGMASAGDSFAKVETGGMDGSLRLRGGYLFAPDLLIYGTGGLSYLDLEVSATCPADTNVCNPIEGTQYNSDSEEYIGWVLGIGIEAKRTNNLVVRVEYSYADYGEEDFDQILPFVGGESFGVDTKVGVEKSSFTLGMAYLF